MHTSQAMLNGNNLTPEASPVCLTKDEKAVLGLIRYGHTSKVISVMLCIGYEKVKKIRQSLFRKLGVKKDTCLIYEAMRQKLID
jgi:DNA-binding NarL/FixJ family response regulator